MKINFIRLQNFRNVEFASVNFDSDSVWICGENAQGKTNLLESVGLLNALRSFRTAKNSAMIRHCCDSAKILVSLEREGLGESEVEITISQKREVLIDGEPEKFSSFIGNFPTVAASSEDIALVRASPETRRREIDMFASSLDAEYLDALKRFHSALSGRNALLRQRETDALAYESFEIQMAKYAQKISAGRKKFLGEIADGAGKFYAILAGEKPEKARLNIRPSCDYSDASSYAQALVESRPADIERATTSHGPHRDDFTFEINSKSAKLYASEGQQRSLVLAFRLAQFEIIKNVRGIQPVLLCDDVLGELDSSRRAAFWKCVSPTAQVIATATSSAPLAENSWRKWKTINAIEGKFLAADGNFASENLKK